MTKEFLNTQLGNCKFPHTCSCKITDAFEEISEKEFYIFDDNEISNTPVQIVSKQNPHQLSIKNNSLNKIVFVKVDKCLFPEEKGKKKCDCILFDSDKFCFVEIKSTVPNGRSKARRNAVLQLEDTIKELIVRDINVVELSAKAIICFENANFYPIQASKKSQQAIFKNKYNIDLSEGNLIEF